MNREEIKIKLKDINERLINGYFKDKQQMDNLTFERERLEFGLKIYDDFGSRTCGNCKYFHNGKIQKYCTNEKSHLLFEDVPSSFGCNKFERKENE